ncbi:kin of IRRE-like protein 2 isoform X1 [Haliotis asinina]|uniref:kin of IRRE-like protein 2 isoform X1 n=1 Tax=Haliotis asinina TaxID=109174 RepID=UPI0035319C64
MCGISSSDPMWPIQGLSVTFSLLGLLWSTCPSVSAARPLRYTNPRFLDTAENITVESGQEAILPCAVENLGPKSVIWKKVSQPHPITIGEYLFAPDSRYFLKRRSTQIANPEWDLHIRDVQPVHAGVYECQISAKEDIVRHVTLHVIDTGKKQKLGIRLLGTPFVEKGDTIKLNCTASAKDYSPQGVDWFKDGIKLRQTDRISINSIPTRIHKTVHSKLEIMRSNMTDAGTYVCRSSQYHIASLKVIVLNAKSSNVKRGYIRLLGQFPGYTTPKAQLPQTSRGTNLSMTTLCLLLPFVLTTLLMWTTSSLSWHR